MTRLALLTFGLALCLTACGTTKPLTPDPNVPCTEGGACDSGGEEGVCHASGECGACQGDGECQSAYGTDYACDQGACVLVIPTGCKSDNDCGDNQTCDAGACTGALVACTGQAVSSSCGQGDLCCTRQSGLKCVEVECCVDNDCNGTDTCSSSGTCVPAAANCGSLTADAYYVDPAATAPFTGSSMCPFKTLSTAFATIRSDDNPNFTEVRIKGGTIDATSEGGAGKFPLSVPAGTSVHTISGVARAVIVAPANTTAFTVQYTSATGTDLSAHLHDLEIKQASVGSGGAGILVLGGSSAHPVQIDHVEIHNFYNGINVGGGGYANINFDVNSHGNKSNGLFIGGGRANLTQSATSGARTHFDGNDTGIWVTSDPASVPVVDSAVDSTGLQMVTASNNVSNGVHLASPNAANSVTHLGVLANGGSGVVFFGGSTVKVRNANIKNNGADGVHVINNGTTSSLAGIDLGVANTDNGHNAFGGNTNTNICVSTTFDTSHLHAGGNTLGTSDCSLPSSGLLVRHFWDCGAHGGGVGENGGGSGVIAQVGVNNCDYDFR